jgi:DNA-binding response OmpR family regulator
MSATQPRPSKLMIVEDDADIREALVDGLTMEGFVVKAASDGEVALEMIKDSAPDLILLDLMLPRMTGWEVMEEMRRRPPLQTIPIVIITAARFASVAPKGSPTFIKPVRLERLIQSIRALLC